VANASRAIAGNRLKRTEGRRGESAAPSGLLQRNRDDVLTISVARRPSTERLAQGAAIGPNYLERRIWTEALGDNGAMPDVVQIGSCQSSRATSPSAPRAILWLQGITLAWMLIECGVSLSAAATAHSPAMFSFGSDSLVELFSATVVLLQFIPGFPLSPHRAAQAAGVLLFVLAAVVAVMATLAFVLRLRPDASPLGIAITIAALIAMPILSRLKRQQAVRHNNPALAADAVQSATCAYLAAITLAGLVMNALFQIYWFDPLAALACLPFLVKEARAAWRGVTCSCC
jgi:hypothetical protein